MPIKKLQMIRLDSSYMSIRLLKIAVWLVLMVLLLTILMMSLSKVNDNDDDADQEIADNKIRFEPQGMVIRFGKLFCGY